MIKRTDIVNLEELEMLEEAELIDEYSYMDKLKKLVRQKDKTALDRLERRIENHESRLERYHKRVLETIKALKKEKFTRDIAIVLEEIENEIGFYKEDLSKRISNGHKKFKRYVEEERWDELGESIIEELQNDIQIWFTLDQKLIGLEEKLIKGEI
jgi:L-rhamnose mutarotase